MDRFDLGSHSWLITSNSPYAQKWFDLGLNWLFGFNHEEAEKCFQECLSVDPDCAMAHWGVAYTLGPFYNYTWRDFGPDELVTRTRRCHQSVQRALGCAGEATAVERDLIEALSSRFPQPHPLTPSEFGLSDDNYSDAMRTVWERHSDNHDVMALFVEALITRTPWQLWDVTTGLPTDGADTLEALAVCDRSIALAKQQGVSSHPAILHLHIHVLEMSNFPDRALASANELGTLSPDAGHLNHMPGHTYVLCGEYEKARLASLRAIEADTKYVAYAGAFNFYTTSRCHDLHLMMYTCMLQGRFADALNAADQMCETLSPEVLGVDGLPYLAATMEAYYSMRMHVLVRFGRWQDIDDAPMPPDPSLYCVSVAMHHYAKGVANAALRNFASALEHQQAFREATARVPTSRRFFNNSAASVLSIGSKMLDGELAYHQGDATQAFEHLREAVRRDDELAYSEPWAWMHPPRHALAALLLEQGQDVEAEALYRADLGLDQSLQRCSQHPVNVWSLHGLVECLTRRNDSIERPALERQLAKALTYTDVSIGSSCMCRGLT